MKIIHGDRATGKTHDLVVESAKTGAIIVVASEIFKKPIKLEAERFNLAIPEPMTFKEVGNSLCGPTITGFLINDLEKCLDFYFKGSYVRTATLSGYHYVEERRISHLMNKYYTDAQYEKMNFYQQRNLRWCPDCELYYNVDIMKECDHGGLEDGKRNTES